MLHLVQSLYERTRSKNLCMAGGVALNCMTNKLIAEKGPFTHMYVQPAANDAGTAIGAAFVIWNSCLKRAYRDRIVHAYWGPSFSNRQIEKALCAHGLVYEQSEDVERQVARRLSQNQIIGWFQGAMEFGPRALGNRSLLADPRDPLMRDKLNARVKHREPFRPYAASVLAEQASSWFQIVEPSPLSDFMLIAYAAREDVKDRMPAVVHVDGTCRLQTVSAATNARYHKLISQFFEITGVPLVLNTSFNDQEPIVCTPEHAIHTFLKTEMDGLAIGDFFVDKRRNDGRDL
jgi:carbamoyltransferase